MNRNPFFMNQNDSYNMYQIGDWSYGTPKVMFPGEGSTLKVGKFCSIAGGTTILLGGEHQWQWATTYPFNCMIPEAFVHRSRSSTKGNVEIGHDVWIGHGSLVLSGNTIANGAVVAARSVVTKDVPPYAIVGGTPAKILRYRFPQTIINELQKIAWWDWPIEKIAESFPLMLNDNIEAFVEKYKVR